MRTKAAPTNDNFAPIGLTHDDVVRLGVLIIRGGDISSPEDGRLMRWLSMLADASPPDEERALLVAEWRRHAH